MENGEIGWLLRYSSRSSNRIDLSPLILLSLRWDLEAICNRAFLRTLTLSNTLDRLWTLTALALLQCFLGIQLCFWPLLYILRIADPKDHSRVNFHYIESIPCIQEISNHPFWTILSPNGSMGRQKWQFQSNYRLYPLVYVCPCRLENSLRAHSLSNRRHQKNFVDPSKYSKVWYHSGQSPCHEAPQTSLEADGKAWAWFLAWTFLRRMKVSLWDWDQVLPSLKMTHLHVNYSLYPSILGFQYFLPPLILLPQVRGLRFFYLWEFWLPQVYRRLHYQDRCKLC